MLRLSTIAASYKLERAVFSHIALFIGVAEYWAHIKSPVAFVVALIAFIFFYGAIYLMNDIADYKVDKMSQKNKGRLLASGKMSIKSAWKIVLITWAVTVIVMWMFSVQLVCAALLLLGVNILYSWIVKKIPYLDIILIASSQPLKFFVGLALCSVVDLPFLAVLPPLLVMYFILVSLHTAKQLVKLEEGDVRFFYFGSYTEKGLHLLSYFGALCSVISLYFSLDSREFWLCLVGVIVAFTFRFGLRSTKSMSFIRQIESTFQVK